MFPSSTKHEECIANPKKDDKSKQIKPSVFDPGSSSRSSASMGTTSRTTAALHADGLEGLSKKTVSSSAPLPTGSISTATRTTPIPRIPTTAQTSTHRFTTTINSSKKGGQENSQVASSADSTEDQIDKVGVATSLMREKPF